jgi:hypothetical protein
VTFGDRIRDLFGRTRPVPVIDPPGYRLPGYAPPPPPPLPLVEMPRGPGSPVGPGPAGAPPQGPHVKLMMADGTIQELPLDPESESRAAYFVRSMLPPAPPPPDPTG